MKTEGAAEFAIKTNSAFGSGTVPGKGTSRQLVSTSRLPGEAVPASSLGGELAAEEAGEGLGVIVAGGRGRGRTIHSRKEIRWQQTCRDALG